MSVKYKSSRKSMSKQYITKRHKHYRHSKKHRVLNNHTHRAHRLHRAHHTNRNLHNIQSHEEHDGHEKMAFDTKHEHYDKVHLILSNLENKKHRKYGTKKTNYRHYKSGF
jgi:hypothetical protein